MKAKEKGIDMSKPQEKDKDNRTKAGAFNAFRLLKEAKNAKKGGRDSRSSGPKKPEDIPESELEITYAGQSYAITREGKLADPEKLSFEKGMVLGFAGIGNDRFSHMDVKVRFRSFDIKQRLTRLIRNRFTIFKLQLLFE